MRRLAITGILGLWAWGAQGQYAPQAGIAGSSAIHKSSSEIVNWATGCSVQRGWMNIEDPSLGLVSSGQSSLGIGAADAFVVSLGDSGVATLTFAHPIVNGAGADFAVFENGFTHTTDGELAYLELAFVEVSSDGVNYFRFPAYSEVQADSQIAGAGVFINARKIHQLAGKYISNYGTPFDLQELANTPGLDINAVTHVRLVDVIGSLDKHASRDHLNRIINDPYPTPWPIGGFDLDAVAVLNQSTTNNIPDEDKQVRLVMYPNPVRDMLQVETDVRGVLQIVDMTGRLIVVQDVEDSTVIDLRELASGSYLVMFQNADGLRWSGRIVKR